MKKTIKSALMTTSTGRQKTCSIKGDHASAIGFYKELLRLSGPITNCEVLSAIAYEYETMGDYGSAEEYWNRCCEIKNYDSYRYIAEKGDFLYRRERYEDAIDTYQEALKTLDGPNDKSINISQLKCYARAIHFIIYSYNYLAKNNMEKEYHNQLRHAIDRYLKSKRIDDERKAYNLSQTAWEIYEDDAIYDEALILNDYAIKIHPKADYYRRKAIFIKYKLEIKVIVKRVQPEHLDMINKALKILPDDCDNGPYLKTKGDILNQLGDPVKAKVCYALAVKDYDAVDEADKLLKKLKHGETYINITGIQYYQHLTPFRQGTVVDLIKEPDNHYDMNAIRVEINGETVGYVANSKYTLIKQVSSATDIKDSNSKQAIVQFILFGEWVIAKLI